MTDKYEEYDLDFLNDNLNINQEIDIQENPKKYQAEAKKRQIENEKKDKKNKYLSSEISKVLNKSKISITYDDIYLGNEVLKARSKTFPRYKEKNKFGADFSVEQEKIKKAV